MNRIRKLGAVYQVLITPSIKESPDSSLLVGNMDDSELRGFYILEFPTLGDANNEAYKHPDIDWFKIVSNHQYIFQRLDDTIKSVLYSNGFTTEYYANLMTADMMKNTMFDRVMRQGNRYNLRYGANDVISFTIVNPWTRNLDKISKALENYRVHYRRDDLRIREKNVINGKVITLLGATEFGSMYEIRLVPTLLYQWEQWYRKTGYMKPDEANRLYTEMIKKQDELDKLVIR